MHIAIVLLTLLASFKWGDWKNWRKYHASMYFIATGGLLYEYIVKGHSLWEFHPDLLYGTEMTVIVYALITMPVSVLIYLVHFPQKNILHKCLYILIWAIIYIVVEWVLLISHRISYQNGWHIWYSFLFDFVMFGVIALHQRHPFPAYAISIVIVVFLILAFHVPFKFLK